MSDTNPATTPVAPPTPSPRPGATDHLPPFKVLLHNDDVNAFDDVMLAVRQLTPLNTARVFKVVYEADEKGVALLLVTHKERAELYVEQFKSKRLTVTIEPA